MEDNTKIMTLEEYSKNHKVSIFRKLFWKLDNHYYNIKCFFFPCHRSLRKVIPKTWQDIDGILENFIFEAFISWVEEEDGLNDRTWNDIYDGDILEYLVNNGIEIEEKFKEIYKYAKKRTWEYPELYPEKETEYLLFLVGNRGFLWT